MPTGGPFDCHPPGWPCYPPRHWPTYFQPIETSAAPHTRVPSVQEQMGVDPVSKLAAAIDRLAAALEGQKQ